MIYLFQTQDNQTKLTPNKLNQEIERFVKKKNQLESTDNLKWDKKVFIDLSKIEWINTSALVELILIIENFIEDGIKVTVALPNRNILSSEERNLKDNPENIKYIEHAIEKRKDAREWLYRLNIIKALSFEHQPEKIRSNIKVLDVFDKEKFDQNPVEKESDYFKKHGPLDAKQGYIKEKYHVPLLWTKGNDYHSNLIKKVLNLSLKDTSHAQIISDIVIKELAKNVEVHSNKKNGLFCAVVGKCKPKKVFPTDYYQSDIPFLEKCNEGEYIIEIVFGDSGYGIINKLQDYAGGRKGVDLLQHSFDKWSTSSPYQDYQSYIDRGTRGLYHIRRVVQNYDGMVAIRNKNFYAGFNDLTSDPFGEEKLHEFKGTLLSLRLLPGRGKTLHGRYYPSTQSDAVGASECEQLSIDISNISEGLNSVGVKSKENSKKNFLISLDFSKLSDDILSDEKQINADLQKLLESLSKLRHPNVHIVYGFPANFEKTQSQNFEVPRIEKIINSVNEAVKLKKEKDEYMVFDPIMIIGPTGSVHWVGVQNQKLVLALNKLMEAEDLSLPIDYIDQKELIEYIKQDAGLFSIQNECIKLNFNKSAPIEYFIKKIQTKIKELAIEGDQRILITPHLKYVKGWLDINEIYKDYKNEYALSLYSLWHNHRFEILKTLFPDRLLKKEKKQDCSNEELDNIQRELLETNLKILVGSEVDIPSGEIFLHLLDIRDQGKLKILSDEEDSKKPRRNRLFDKDDYVIIITSVVSTAETAKSLIKSVLRSNATPVCLLSLANFSGDEFAKDQKPIVQWGNSVLFYSIITSKDLIASKPQKNIGYKSIIGNEDEKIPQKDSFYVEDELREMILASKSLHFSHIGKPNKRHFTFYFNAKRFLNEINEEHTTKIWNKLKEAINKFYRSRDINLDSLDEGDKKTVGECTPIWYPDREYKKGYQGQGDDLSVIIKAGLKKDYNIDINEVNSVSRDDTLTIGYNLKPDKPDKPDKEIYNIIVDWGSITGESIEKLIYKAHKNGFNNIFVCIFLNQLSGNKKAYLKSISTITSDPPLPSDNEGTHQPIAVTNTIELLHNQRTKPPKQLELFDEKNLVEREPKIELFNTSNLSHPQQIDSCGNQPEILTEKRSNKDNFKTEPFISNVHIEFINDFPLTCYESDYECNVCALREDLEKYEIPNTILEDYAKKRRWVLDIRPRKQTLREPFDFYSEDQNEISLDQEFILRMFEFKTLLMNAQSSTFWRFRIKVELIKILKSIINNRYSEGSNSLSKIEIEIWKSITINSNDITKNFQFMFPEMCDSEKIDDYNIDAMDSRTHAMIYFLSVETSWIQKPPLSNDEFRKMLSLISRAIIFNSNLRLSRNGKKDTNVIRIKYAAITVLRMADKNDFIENIFAILNNTQIDDIGSNSIIENILFHINTFISKDYHAKHEDLIGLKSILDHVEEAFYKHPSLNKWRNGIWYLKILVNNLRVRGIFRHYNSAEIVKSCLKSYKETFLHYRHSEVETKFRKLCFPVSFLNPTELKNYELRINELHKNWEYVSDTISNLYILTLKSIPKILASEWLAGNDTYKVGQLNLKEKIGYDDEFSKLLKRIQEDRTLLMNPNFMENYNHQINLIRDFFIIHPNSTNTGESARVFSFLDAIKSKYSVAIKLARDFLAEKQDGCTTTIGEIVTINNQIDNPPTFFYPQKELNFLLSQVVENCYKHRNTNFNKVIVYIHGSFQNKYYNIKIDCFGTKTEISSKEDLLQPKYQGHGLNKIINSLNSFEGKVDFKRIRDGYEFIFEILCI